MSQEHETSETKKIQVLPPDVANLIAAGEVVERPASVVKELLENSIDAGATSITVEIRNGGTDYLRITDNGKGIAPEELPTAFLRHATSKMKAAEDLEEIITLGFRGEALAAIAAVSKIKVTSGRLGETFAQELILEGGVIISQEETGAPVGTTMLVEDLFFNTPARKKFMKTTRGEGAAIFSLVQVVALSHPEIAIKFIRDGKVDLTTSGDGELSTAIFHVLGKDIALGLREVAYSDLETKVTGYVCLPSCCRASRNFQHFFVNGRYIKSPLLCTALEEAYKNQKMVGKFPAAVLHLTMDYRDVDVNVHPAKTQVKFAREQEIFRLFHRGVLESLEGHRDIQKVVFQQQLARSENLSFEAQKQQQISLLFPEKEEVSTQIQDNQPDSNFDAEKNLQYSSVKENSDTLEEDDTGIPHFPYYNPKEHGKSPPTLEETKDISPHGHRKESPPVEKIEKAPLSKEFLPPSPLPSSTPHFTKSSNVVHSPLLTLHKNTEENPKTLIDFGEEEYDFKGEIGQFRENSSEMEEKSSEPVLPLRQRVDWKKSEEASHELMEEEETSILENFTYDKENPPWRVVGEFFRTYIVVELGDEMFFIDKHAAHERMNFNRLKNQNYRPMGQTLLKPIVVALSPEEITCVEQNIELLQEFSFDVDVFSGQSVIVRGAPHDIPPEQVENTLLELLQTLLSGAIADPNATRDHLLHSISCKAAIKAGYFTHEEEQAVVAELIMEDKVKHCPHGRPIIASLSKKELEKKFKRIQ